MPDIKALARETRSKHLDEQTTHSLNDRLGAGYYVVSTMSHTYKRHPQTAGRVIDGLAFVITANDNRLHTLNESGTLLWELAQPGTTVEAAALAMIREFEVDLERARLDVFECVQALVEREILVAVEAVELERP